MVKPNLSESISIVDGLIPKNCSADLHWSEIKQGIRQLEQAYDEQLKRNSELSKGNAELIEDYGVLKYGYEALEKLNAELKRTCDLVVEERNSYRKQAESIKLIHWDSVPKSSRSNQDGYASPQTAKLASLTNANRYLVLALNEIVNSQSEG